MINAKDLAGELPDEIRQLLELKKQKSKERVEALGKIVSTKRTDAVSARKSSGIERIWKEDEEYYLGIDDLNRANNVFTKSMSTDGGLSSSSSQDSDGRCTAFFNITRQFVDSASARMGDILLPAGDWNFTIKPTPVPDLDKIKGSPQAVVDANGTPINKPDGSPNTLGEFAKKALFESGEKVKKAETRIRDWLTECSYHSEIRKVIEDAAKIGTGVIRGAYPALSKVRVVMDGALVIEEKTLPTSKRVDPRNFFPDPACGDNIQNGSYVLERDFLSARQLRELRNADGYIAENIDKVLAEGVNKANLDTPTGEGAVKDSDRFEVWYYFGIVDIDDLDALGVKLDNTPNDYAPAVVVLVNDTVIKGFVNPIDNGSFPYDVMAWQRITDSWCGIGIARQGRTAQEMLLASARTMMENAGLSSAPQIIIRQSAIRPADGNWALVKGKVWIATEEADTRSVSDAFLSIMIPSMQQELSNMITMAYKMMEDATGVSFLLQGQQGSAPDTVGGMQLLHQNASSLLRRIARVFDESITEPHIRRYYDWLLIHGEDDEKGDCKIEAIGSTSLVEREIQAQQAAQILQMALNPAFGYSPKKAADELLRAWRFDPAKFDMSEEEKQAAAQQQQPPAPQVQAAQIRAETEKAIAEQRLQAEMQMDKNDVDRDAIYVQSQTERDRNQANYQMQKLQLERELALLKYSNERQITLDKAKADLSGTVLKLRTQKELAAMDGNAPQVITPPTEPLGRAENGRAYQE